MRTKIAAVALAGGLVLAACGGGGSQLPDGVSLPEPAPGPVPELAVSADAAASSPLPDIAVRQLNGDGGWVQLKNALPADKPLLVWFWAPH
jgi:ABC-type glycerol-3-phosphate transport system substrate-binding protein